MKKTLFPALAAALVLAALYVISILSDIPGVFGALFTVLGGYPVY